MWRYFEFFEYNSEDGVSSGGITKSKKEPDGLKEEGYVPSPDTESEIYYIETTKEAYVEYRLENAYNDDKFYALVIAKFNFLDSQIYAPTRFDSTQVPSLVSEDEDFDFGTWVEFMYEMTNHIGNEWIQAEDKEVLPEHRAIFAKVYSYLADTEFKQWLTSILEAAQHQVNFNWLKQLAGEVFGTTTLSLSTIDIDKNKFL